MARTISGNSNAGLLGDSLNASELAFALEKNGRFPPIQILIKPLNGSPSFRVESFLGYNFKNSILIPVDSFSFTFAAPDDPRGAYEFIKDGDIVELYANGVQIAAGIIDSVTIETDQELGERVTIEGRDLMGQLEDQDVVNSKTSQQYAGNFTITQVVNLITQDTRMKRVPILVDAPIKPYLFATEAGETKLTALQRYLEPLNCLAWMAPNGQMTVGRPQQMEDLEIEDVVYVRKSGSGRGSNVLSATVRYAATNIPTEVLPVYTSQENVQVIIGPQQKILNAFRNVDRLRRLGHFVPKMIVSSNPQGGNPQDLADINLLNNSLAADSTLLQALAKRDMARKNAEAYTFRVIVPGHYNARGNPFLVNTIYRCIYDRGSLDEKMFLYDVEYQLAQDGQRTILNFCPLGTIVSDIRAK